MDKSEHHLLGFSFRVVDALLEPTLRCKYLHMPMPQEQRGNIQEVFTKYKIDNVIGGIDSCHILFEEKPR